MKKIIFALVFLICISFAYAQPALPIQIYGSITPTIEDGTAISFEIDGLEVASGSITNNKYGYSPLVFIKQDDLFTQEKEGYVSGDMVFVYVGDVKVKETVLTGSIIELNLIVPSTVTTTSTTTSTSTTRSGTSTGSGGICSPTWECSDWSSCSNGRETRTCIDKWSCGTSSGKPPVSRTCVVEQPPAPSPVIVERPPIIEQPNVVEKERSFVWAYIVLSIIVLSILGGLGFVFYERRRSHSVLNQEKQQSSLEQQSMIRLQSYVRQTLQQGYTQEQVIQSLLREGWSQNIINKTIKGV